MQDSPSEIALIGFALAALAYGALALRLAIKGYLHPSAGRAPHAFLLALVASAAWALGSAGAARFPDIEWLAPATWAFDLLRYGAWFWFVLVLLRPALRGPRAASEAGFLRPAASIVVMLGVAGIVLPMVWDSPTAARLGLFAALTQAVFGLLLVEQLLRNVARDGRWGVKPLCLALGGLFAFDLYLNSQAVLFGAFDEDAFSIRPTIHALAVPLLLIATRRLGDVYTRLQVSHNAAFYSATLLLVGAYLIFVSAVGYYVRFTGGSWGRALQLALLFAAVGFLAALLLSGSLRARVRVFVSKHFFAYRYDYREQWLRFTTLLSAPASPQEMGLLVVRGLSEMVGSPGGSLWTLSATDGSYSESARTHRLVEPLREAAHSAFVRFLARDGWIVDLREAREHPERYADLALPDWLKGDHDVWAVVPLLVGEQLTGFVLLARPHADTELDWEVRDLLKTASRQAAVFLAQLHATEALLEARKFDAFNRMSAFVVHDLKNIVTQLSLMMKNAKRLHDNPEFQQDMLMTVESSLDKMRQLMLQLREGARPPGGALGVELQPLVQRIAQVAAQRGRALELRQVERIATRGQEERLERVLGHLVQNAFDATPPEGRVWLELKRVSGQAQVIVGDTGQGMTPEFVQNRLFKPFASTKAAGMGIGSYESSQYVRELGGRIDVDSEPGRGTVITVTLPLFEAQHESDLKMTTPA